MNEKTPHQATRGGLAACPNSNPIARFREAILSAGQAEPFHVEADGALHRYRDPEGKTGNTDLWFVLHIDGIPTGVFGSWKTGAKHTWCAKSQNQMTPAERDEHRRRMEDARRQRKQEQERTHSLAAVNAKTIWAKSEPANPDHPYLAAKGVTAGIAKQSQGALVLPIVNMDGEVRSLQFIQQDGTKRMLSGGQKRGNFIPAGDGVTSPSRVIVCEGWATARSLSEIDRTALVLAAIDAGNLESVATNARIKWPDLPLVIACDDDRQTEGNPGMTKGRAAAIASGAKIISPEWPEDAPLKLSDFNDLHQWLKTKRGAE